MFPLSLPTFEANGTIEPRRFVAITAGTNNRVDQATGSGVPMIGISGDFTRFASGAYNDGNGAHHAIVGEFVTVMGPGQITNLDLGANVTDLSVPLTSDGSGKGTPVNFAAGQTTAVWCGAFPTKLGSSGEWIPVYVLSPFRMHPALS